LVDAARRKEYAQLINDSGQHLLGVVKRHPRHVQDGIPVISRFRQSRSRRDRRCSIAAICWRSRPAKAALNLVTRAPEVCRFMTGDPRAFKQIVLNLVANAIKFTERGGSVTVSRRRGIATDAPRHRHRVGIAPDDLKRIGDPFFQAGKTYQRKHEGTGSGCRS